MRGNLNNGLKTIMFLSPHLSPLPTGEDAIWKSAVRKNPLLVKIDSLKTWSEVYNWCPIFPLYRTPRPVSLLIWFPDANMTCMKYRIHIEQDEDGVFVSECPTLPGCISQGETRHEAVQNIQDAIEGYLASLREHDEPIPPSIHEELVEVAI